MNIDDANDNNNDRFELPQLGRLQPIDDAMIADSRRAFERIKTVAASLNPSNDAAHAHADPRLQWLHRICYAAALIEHEDDSDEQPDGAA